MGAFQANGCTWHGSTEGFPTIEMDLSESGSGRIEINNAFAKAGANTYRFNFMGTGPDTAATKTYTLVTFGSTTFNVADFSYVGLSPDYIGEFILTAGALQFQVTRDPLRAWRERNFGVRDNAGNAANTANPDGDADNNMLEFAFDGDPKSGADEGKRTTGMVEVAGTNYFTLTLPVRTGATFSGSTELVSAPIDGIIYRIQGSTDLTAFPNVPVIELASSPFLWPPPTYGWEYRTFGIIAGSNGFIRAAVSAAP